MNSVDVINDYKSGLGIEKIAAKNHVGKLKIRQILLKNNIPIKEKGAVKKNTCQYREFLLTPDNGFVYIAKCKKTNKIFYDYSNKSGILSKHLKKINVKTLKSNEGIVFYKKHGYHWFTKYFDFIQISNNKHNDVECKICNKKYKSNKGGHLTRHILKKHKLKISDYLLKYPKEKDNFKEKEALPKIKCMLCGKEMRIITNTHLHNKHNITMFEYKKKFPSAKIIADDIRKNYQNKTIKLNTELKIKRTSSGQKEVEKFLKSLKVRVKRNDRAVLNGLEIDLYLPDFNLGIEYNGVRFHTENYGKKDSTYHLNKTTMANTSGVALIHIFEDEWILKNDVVKAKLKHMLNLSTSKKIYARKCHVRPVTNKVSNEFLEQYHLQGKVNATFYFGLFYGDILTAVMTFNNRSGGTYELSRFSSNHNYIVIGGASKLLNYFINNENNINKITTFADRRWTVNSDDNLYTKIGFSFNGITKPDYRYFNSSYHRLKRHHKFGFRKKILLKKYPEIVNINMTEKQMTEKLGFDKIWDCGLFKYELLIKA